MSNDTQMGEDHMKNIRFRFKSFTYEMYDRPGTWMTEAQLEALQTRLVTVAVDRLGTRPTYGIFADARHLDNKLITICSRDGRDLCFSAMVHLGTYAKRPVIHLGSVYSLQGQKGQMQLLYVWNNLHLLAHNLFRPIYITSMTHTPRIFGAVQEAYGKVYPRAGAGDGRPEPFHEDIRDMLMETYLKEFSLAAPPAIDDRFVIKGMRRMADGTLLIPDTRDTVPKHRKTVYNDFCLERLDYANGDDILQVGVLRAWDLVKDARLFRKGGRLRPMNVLHNIGAQAAGFARGLARWIGAGTAPRRRRTSKEAS